MWINIRIYNFTRYFKYIPKKVISGLVSGISLIIIAQELPSLLRISQVSGSIIHKFLYILSNVKTLNLTTFIIGLITIITLIFYPKNFDKIFPASLFLIIIFLLFKTFISVIPFSLLSGILILVAIKMNKLNVIKYTFLHPLKNAEFLITFASALLFDISIAILLGILVSIIKKFIIKNNS